MGPTSIPIATPSFPMASRLPKGYFSNSLARHGGGLELFRHLLLRRLHQEERLSERFMENLLSWVHPGFSVFAGEPLSPQDAGQLECLARYITRPPPAADSIRRGDDGLLQITTPPDPRNRLDGAPIVSDRFNSNWHYHLRPTRSPCRAADRHKSTTDCPTCSCTTQRNAITIRCFT
jgi:hypothetical protein